MQQLPFGYQIKAITSGISALYVTFIVGCLILAVIALWVLPDGILRYLIIIASLVTFFALVIFGCYIICKKPERFSIKEEHHIIIEYRTIKMIEEAEPKPAISKPRAKPSK